MQETLSMTPANEADRWTLANLAPTFHTSTDSALMARNGQPFTLLGRTPDDQYDRVEAEAGSMWRIRFPDGAEVNVYGDEIAR